MMPFNLTVFFTAILIVRLYNRFTPRQIARYSFLLVTVGALLVGLLSSMIMRNLVDNPVIPPEFKRTELAEQFDLNNINFIRNEQLKERLQQTTATPEKVDEAVRINTESRLRALKIAFFILAGLALLAIFPCSRLPDYRPGEVPSGQAQGVTERGERKSA